MATQSFTATHSIQLWIKSITSHLIWWVLRRLTQPLHLVENLIRVINFLILRHFNWVNSSSFMRNRRICRVALLLTLIRSSIIVWNWVTPRKSAKAKLMKSRKSKRMTRKTSCFLWRSVSSMTLSWCQPGLSGSKGHHQSPKSSIWWPVMMFQLHS